MRWGDLCLQLWASRRVGWDAENGGTRGADHSVESWSFVEIRPIFPAVVGFARVPEQMEVNAGTVALLVMIQPLTPSVVGPPPTQSHS
jgi:hypothetical protein